MESSANDAMTTPSAEDLERARKFWGDFYVLSPFQSDRPHEDVTVPMLGAQFAAVRAEERAKVVAEIAAWVRSLRGLPLGTVPDAMANLADNVERKWGWK